MRRRRHSRHVEGWNYHRRDAEGRILTFDTVASLYKHQHTPWLHHLAEFEFASLLEVLGACLRQISIHVWLRERKPAPYISRGGIESHIARVAVSSPTDPADLGSPKKLSCAAIPGTLETSRMAIQNNQDEHDIKVLMVCLG